MLVRAFQIGDTPILIKLFQNTVRKINSKDYSPEQIRAWAPDQIDSESWEKRLSNSFTFVALEGSDIIGFANLEENGHIDLFYVHANWQRKGVAEQIFSQIESKAKEMKLERLFAEVSITAKPFFQKKGFIIEKEQTVSLRSVSLTNFVMVKLTNTKT